MDVKKIEESLEDGEAVAFLVFPEQTTTFQVNATNNGGDPDSFVLLSDMSQEDTIAWLTDNSDFTDISLSEIPALDGAVTVPDAVLVRT